LSVFGLLLTLIIVIANQSVVQTLADLVSINSVNPAYEGGVSEAGVCAYIREFFARRGIETSEQEVFTSRPNLIARLPGRNPKRRVILEAHTDTASVQGMSIPPFEPRVADGRLYGRGACDTKAGLAAMMHAVASLKEDGRTPPCEVWLAAVADEEFSFRGVVKLCDGLSAHAAMVAEPTELRAVIASKGVLRWSIAVRGQAAHSSKPHVGVNAITHMARVILAFEKDHRRLAKKPHPLLGPATCNVGVIHGGVQVNVVPDSCVIEVDRRLLPGETADAVLEDYQRMFVELRTKHPSLDAVMERPMLVDEALETAPDSPPARLASRLLGDMGLDATLGGVPFGSDASKLSRAGVPSLVFGPGSIDRAHAAVEYVEVDQVLRACEFYREFILRFE
jgi:acetylornithine deacetylase ArgE